MGRTIVMILAALTVGAGAWDVGDGGMDAIGDATLGGRWFQIHRASLIGLQSGLENRVGPDLYFDYVQPVMELSATGLLAGLTVLALLLTTLRRR